MGEEEVRVLSFEIELPGVPASCWWDDYEEKVKQVSELVFSHRRGRFRSNYWKQILAHIECSGSTVISSHM